MKLNQVNAKIALEKKGLNKFELTIWSIWEILVYENFLELDFCALAGSGILNNIIWRR